MDLGQIVKSVVAVLTVVTGLLSLIWPRVAARFTGFGDHVGPRGLSEIRTVLGGAFVGLGAAPFLLGLDKPEAFQMLGIMYLTAALVRSASILALDRDSSRSSLISVGVEWLFGILLLLIP